MKVKVIHTPYYNVNLLALNQMGKSDVIFKQFMFTEESKYETKNPSDQEDWNKLTGLASYPFNSQKSSHMWAWRYYNNNFEIAPYSHNSNGDKILPTPAQITVIPINQPFTLWIIPNYRKDGTSVLFEVRSGSKEKNNLLENKFKEQLLLIPKDYYRIITSWFGGSSLPKKTVKIYGN